MAVGITQADLAKAVGLTFQQIQKYESGANQIVSSRLYELAAVLGVPVSFFFEGLARSERSGVANLAGLSLLATAEAQRLDPVVLEDRQDQRAQARARPHPVPVRRALSAGANSRGRLRRLLLRSAGTPESSDDRAAVRR